MGDLINIGHNLSELWVRAANQGLPIGDTPPQWAERLNGLHGRPYYLRYPIGLNGLILPNAPQTTADLQNLIDSVRKGMDSL